MRCNLNLLLNFILEEECEDITSLRNEIALAFVWRKDDILPAVEELAIKRGFIARDLKGLKLPKLEFFWIDGEPVGIGAVNYADRKRFNLIHDTELSKNENS